MKTDDYDSIATKCFECGRNWFKLTRMEKGQVLAECTHCGHSHILDSVLEKQSHIPVVYWFSAPKKIERCVDCRAELKIWDVSYNGKLATSKCSKCGLTHTFKKPRFRGWQLLHVSRIIGDQVINLNYGLSLTEIKGIGSKRAMSLNLVGIKTISDLANSTALILSSRTGISEKLLLRWIEQAKSIVK